jgi:hypothetical protein
MSILDFTTGLFREPANLRSFVDDLDQALEDAGFPTPRPIRSTTCFRLSPSRCHPITLCRRSCTPPTR